MKLDSILKSLAWLALTVLLVSATILMWDVRRVVLDTRVEVKAAITNVNSILAQTTQAVGSVRQMADSEKAYWDANKQKVEAVFTKLTNTIDFTNKFLKDLNQSLNHGTLPAMTKTLEQTTTTLAKTQEATLEAIAGIRKDITPILQNAAQATEDLVKLTSDPELKKLLVQLNDLIAELNRGADNATEILATASLTMKRIDDRVKQLTKPGSMIWNLIKGLVGIGSQGRVLVEGK